MASFVDDYASVSLNVETFSQMVRTAECVLLVRSVKCQCCKSYQGYLRKSYARWSQRSPERVIESSSHVNDRFMCTPEKKAKLAKLRTRAKVAEQNVNNLKARLQELSEKQGENMDSSLHGDLLGIMNSENEAIRQSSK